MLITISVLSILAISTVVWLANRVLPFVVCPIWAGVFLTWLGLLAAHFIMGYQIALIVPALLMGGSVVGIAYQLEKKLRGSSADMLLLWKVFFIPIGFAAAYAVLEQWWTTFLFAFAFLAALSMWFFSSHSMTGPHEETIGDIEKKMEDCC